MTFRTWNLAVAAAVVALTGCAGLQTEDTSTAAEDLSVFNWTTDTPTGKAKASLPPAIASIEDFVLEVYPADSITDPGYLHWGVAFQGNVWPESPIQMNPHATSTAQPTLAAFNGHIYLFYASGVDQYMARFNPVNFTWTGSTLLPFTSLGAVAAISYNGSLAIIRVDPSTKQLMMRTMSTAEVFSAEQPVVYNTAASDPCQQVVVFPGGLSTTATAPVAPPSPSISIGIYFNDMTDSTPALAVAGNCLYVAHRNGSTSTLVYNTFSNGSWGPLRTVTSGAGGAAQASAVQPVMANFAGALQMIYVGGGGSNGGLFWTTYNGNWAAPLSIPNHQSQGTPSLALAFNELIMLHLGQYASDSDVWHSTYTP